MTNNLKKKSSNRQKVAADDFNQTIVNIMGPARLKDLCPVMREASGAHQESLGEQQFKMRLAQTNVSRSAATMLADQRYAWRGYKAGEIRKPPNLITLLAYLQDQIVGSLNTAMTRPRGCWPRRASPMP